MIPPQCADFCLSFLDHRAPVVVLLVDTQGTVTKANRYAVQLLGRDPAGASLAEVFFDPHGVISLKAMAQDSQQTHLLHVNIAPRPAQSLYFHVCGVNDGFLMLGCHDSAEQVRLEQNVLSLNQELSNLSRDLQQRTAELGRVVDTKNQLLGMAAHDLRNPASAIVSFSEILLNEAAAGMDPTHREFLQCIKDASQRMTKLIEDFLDASIIDAGHLELHLEPANIADVVNEAVRCIKFRATPSGIELTTEAEPNLPAVPLDAPKIVQVLGNLISNAIEYSPAGSTVHLRSFGTPDGVQVSVRDSGPGIPADQMPSLFTPFSTTGQVKTSGQRSIGLGLAIARKIIDAHHGRIWAESTPGQGTTFHFVLPRNGSD